LWSSIDLTRDFSLLVDLISQSQTVVLSYCPRSSALAKSSFNYGIRRNVTLYEALILTCLLCYLFCSTVATAHLVCRPAHLFYHFVYLFTIIFVAGLTLIYLNSVLILYCLLGSHTVTGGEPNSFLRVLIKCQPDLLVNYV
jgi:hypothetical protein